MLPHRLGPGLLPGTEASHPGTQGAEALVARLGALAAAPARISWDPGLRRDRGLEGYTSPRQPDELHVDPGLSPDLMLEVAAHEFVHSLELRGMVRCIPVLINGLRCSMLAMRAASSIAGQAAATSSDVLLEQALATAIFEHTGTVPVRFARTRRSSR